MTSEEIKKLLLKGTNGNIFLEERELLSILQEYVFEKTGYRLIINKPHNSLQYKLLDYMSNSALRYYWNKLITNAST